MTTPAESGETPRTVVLNRSTLVPVGVVLTCMLMLGGGVLTSWRYFEEHFGGIKTQLEKQDRRLEALEKDNKSRDADGWSYTEERLWVSEFRRMNPDMRIPEAKK